MAAPRCTVMDKLLSNQGMQRRRTSEWGLTRLLDRPKLAVLTDLFQQSKSRARPWRCAVFFGRVFSLGASSFS